jgi:hypothetical protein
MAGRFFKLAKPKPFNIKPRYYNPDLEERQERERKIKAELGIKDDNDPYPRYAANIKGQFLKAAGKRTKITEAAKRKSNNRLLVLILILAILFYLLFYR